MARKNSQVFRMTTVQIQVMHPLDGANNNQKERDHTCKARPLPDHVMTCDKKQQSASREKRGGCRDIRPPTLGILGMQGKW